MTLREGITLVEMVQETGCLRGFDLVEVNPALAKDEALKSLFEGVSATERQLDAAFTRQQIKRLWPEGEKFDSNPHQAMFEVPGTDQPNGTVVQVLQAGYVMHDRLLRPALVGVAKGEPKPAGDTPGHVDTVA